MRIIKKNVLLKRNLLEMGGKWLLSYFSQFIKVSLFVTRSAPSPEFDFGTRLMNTHFVLLRACHPKDVGTRLENKMKSMLGKIVKRMKRGNSQLERFLSDRLPS